ncbi:MAG: anaerobic ribonucleoside-triphosphate reductase activating protein [bacterium]|nr:anaerobic ribonucleoside-triphosphate reductase activating protein [bacterium]
MLIAGLQKTTLIDYPGKIAATVFLAGCSFRCPWCYSSELVLPEKIRKQPRISEKELFAFLKKRKGLLDGAVLCGGEPTTNKDLPDLIKKIKKLGFLVKLDTNGSNPKMLEKLIKEKLLDYVAMDIKAPLGAKIQIPKSKFQKKSQIPISKYQKATGVKVDLEKIKKSIEIIKESGIDYEFRSTVVPGLHSKKDIVQIAKGIAPARAYFLQNFRPEKTLNPRFKKLKPYPQEVLAEIKKEIAKHFSICETR